MPSLQDLPDVVLDLLVEFIDEASLVAFALLAPNLRDAAQRRVVRLCRSGNLYILNQELMATFGNSITSLDLSGCCQSPEPVIRQAVSSCPMLRDLNVVNTRLAIDNLLAYINAADHLKTLHCDLLSVSSWAFIRFAVRTGATFPFPCSGLVELYVEIPPLEMYAAFVADWANACGALRRLRVLFVSDAESPNMMTMCTALADDYFLVITDGRLFSSGEQRVPTQRCRDAPFDVTLWLPAGGGRIMSRWCRERLLPPPGRLGERHRNYYVRRSLLASGYEQLPPCVNVTAGQCHLAYVWLGPAAGGRDDRGGELIFESNGGGTGRNGGRGNGSRRQRLSLRGSGRSLRAGSRAGASGVDAACAPFLSVIIVVAAADDSSEESGMEDEVDNDDENKHDGDDDDVNRCSMPAKQRKRSLLSHVGGPDAAVGGGTSGNGGGGNGGSDTTGSDSPTTQLSLPQGVSVACTTPVGLHAATAAARLCVGMLGVNLTELNLVACHWEDSDSARQWRLQLARMTSLRALAATACFVPDANAWIEDASLCEVLTVLPLRELHIEGGNECQRHGDTCLKRFGNVSGLGHLECLTVVDVNITPESLVNLANPRLRTLRLCALAPLATPAGVACLRACLERCPNVTNVKIGHNSLVLEDDEFWNIFLRRPRLRHLCLCSARAVQLNYFHLSSVIPSICQKLQTLHLHLNLNLVSLNFLENILQRLALPTRCCVMVFRELTNQRAAIVDFDFGINIDRDVDGFPEEHAYYFRRRGRPIDCNALHKRALCCTRSFIGCPRPSGYPPPYFS